MKRVMVSDGKVYVTDDRWVTIGGEDEDGSGHHVLIKENGTIVAGFGKGKNVKNAFGGSEKSSGSKYEAKARESVEYWLKTHYKTESDKNIKESVESVRSQMEYRLKSAEKNLRDAKGTGKPELIKEFQDKYDEAKGMLDALNKYYDGGTIRKADIPEKANELIKTKQVKKAGELLGNIDVYEGKDGTLYQLKRNRDNPLGSKKDGGHILVGKYDEKGKFQSIGEAYNYKTDEQAKNILNKLTNNESNKKADTPEKANEAVSKKLKTASGKGSLSEEKLQGKLRGLDGLFKKNPEERQQAKEKIQNAYNRVVKAGKIKEADALLKRQQELNERSAQYRTAEERRWNMWEGMSKRDRFIWSANLDEIFNEAVEGRYNKQKGQ